MATAEMPGLCLWLEGRARPLGSPWEGSWQPSLLDQAKMGFSSVWRQGPAENPPSPAPSSHTAREHCSRELWDSMSPCLLSQVEAGPKQGGAVLGKQDPEVSSPSPVQERA